MKKLVIIGEGRSHYICDWCNSLQERGWKVSLITLDSLEDCFRKNTYDSDIKVYSLHKHKIPKLHVILQIKSAFLILKKIKPDLVQIHDILGCGHLTLLYRSCPIVGYEWGFYMHIVIRRNYLRFKFASFIYKKLSYILTFTKTSKSHISKIYGLPSNKIESIIWGTYIQDKLGSQDSYQNSIRKELNLDKDTILFFSNRAINPYYRNHYLLKIIPQLVKHNPNIFFLFCRGGASTEILNIYKNLVRKLGIENHVKIYDEMLSFDRICQIQMESNIMLHLPYLDNGSSALSESMITKNILVLSDNPYYRERVQDGVNAIIVNPSSNQFLNQFKAVLDNLNVYDEAFLQKNHDYAMQHENWNLQVDKVSEVYKRFI